MSSLSASSAASSSAAPGLFSRRTLLLALGAIGVVFGDIGTSPLYAFREALAQTAEGGITAEEIIGVMSMAIWALIIVVTCKYVLFLMRADNEGEGGVLALLALAGRATGRRTGLLLVLGVVGASLFYGDAMITPALSVLSAVEGLKTLPGIGAGITEKMIIAITLAILILLFAIQSRGTDLVSRLFGPICLIWFIALAVLGIVHIGDEPAILAAFSPHHAVGFVAGHGVMGLFVLGAVFLTVTGAEALTADMGHFGRVPIQLGWFALVFPALVLNYLGQGALALHMLEAAQAKGTLFANQDWFFLMAPGPYRVPLVIIATLATIIASQAVITGAFSLTQQAIQLGLLPRLTIVQTSHGHAGQIYMPLINWALLVGVLILVMAFRNSSAMAAAYGIAVTGTMVVTSCLAFVVVRRLWKWRLAGSLALIAPFLALDLIFFGANLLRVVEGGWVPLLIALILIFVMRIWLRGRGILAQEDADNAIPITDMAAMLARRPPRRVEGSAIFMTGNADVAPGALLHNLKHNKVLHEHNLLLSVRTKSVPHVPLAERMAMTRIDENFSAAVMSYGFMDKPELVTDLETLLDPASGFGDVKRASYFIGRNTLKASGEVGMPVWQDLIYIFLHRNSANPTAWFEIPSNRVVELGAQLAI